MSMDIIDKTILECQEKNEKLSKEEQEAFEKIEELKAASSDERAQSRVVMGCIPYVLAGIAAVGLSHFGYVDPSLTGAISLGTGVVAGAVGEAHLVRKVVDSKTLDASSYQILRNKVFKTIQKENIIQKKVTNLSKLNALTSAKVGQFEFDGDALAEKRCVEDVLNSLAYKIALVENDCSKYVQFNTIAKDALTALGIYGAYMVPLSIAGGEINGTQVMIPTVGAMFALMKNAYYESEKRKINKKYHRLMRYDIDTDSLVELKELTNDYAKRLGKIEAQLLLAGQNEKEDHILNVEDDSLFLQIWSKISEEKEKGLYRSKSK